MDVGGKYIESTPLPNSLSDRRMRSRSRSRSPSRSISSNRKSSPKSRHRSRSRDININDYESQILDIDSQEQITDLKIQAPKAMQETLKKMQWNELLKKNRDYESEILKLKARYIQVEDHVRLSGM